MTTITLAHAGTTIALSDRLGWTAEFDWHPVEQAASYSTTGALLIDVATRQAGRPPPLHGTDTQAWMTRTTMQQLAAWAAIPGAELTLTVRGVARDVVFDHAQGGFTAEPIWRLLDGEVDAELLYRRVLKFLEV